MKSVKSKNLKTRRKKQCNFGGGITIQIGHCTEESLEMHPHKCIHLIFDKRKGHFTRERQYTQTHAHIYTQVKLNLGLMALTKIKVYGLTIYLSIKCKTVKLLKDNLGENLDNLEFVDNSSVMTPKDNHKRNNPGRLDFIKI